MPISPLSTEAPVELIFTQVDMGTYPGRNHAFTISYQSVEGF